MYSLAFKFPARTMDYKGPMIDLVKLKFKTQKTEK